MGIITAADGTELYVKDWGTGQPVVFDHAYCLNSDASEDQMFCLASNGLRCIAHDRRGHGRSGQPWQGNDMNTLPTTLPRSWTLSTWSVPCWSAHALIATAKDDVNRDMLAFIRAR